MKRATRFGTIASLAFACVLGVGTAAGATWQEPACNPDIVGPTDPSCNVASPLNAANVLQQKTGTLLVNNTLSAADLEVSSAIAGNGNMRIRSLAGQSMHIEHDDPGATAVRIVTGSDNDLMWMIQDGAGGTGVSVKVSAPNTTGVYLGSSATSPYPLNIELSTATNTTGVEVLGSPTGIGLQSLGGNWGIQSEGFKFGIEAVGSGAASRAATFSSATNGAPVYVFNDGGGYGLAAEGGNVEASTIATVPPMAPPGHDGIRATTDNGYGIIGYSNISSGDGAGVLGLGQDDRGVIGWSDEYFGVYGNTQRLNANGGVFCNQGTNCARLAADNGRAIRLEGDSIVDGEATIDTDNLSDAIEALNTTHEYGIGSYVNTATLPPAVGLAALHGQSNNGIGVGAYSETATGLVAQAGSAAEIFGTTAGAVVNASGGATGIQIDSLPFETAMFVNTSIVHSFGAYEGGQFYPYQHGSDGIHRGIDSQILKTIGTGADRINRMTFDGSDIWGVSTGSDATLRYSAVDGRLTHRYAHAATLNPNVPLYLEHPTTGQVVYVFGASGAYEVISLEGPTIAAGNIGVAEGVYAAAFDGDSIWLSTNFRNIYDWDVFGGGGLTLVTSLSTVGQDMIFADGKIAVPDFIAGQIVTIDPDTYGIDIIPGTPGAYGIAHDGYYYWTSDTMNDRIHRTDPLTKETKSYDMTLFSGDVPRYMTFDGGKLWVAVQNSNAVASFDIAREEWDEVIPFVRSPMAPTFDGTNVWVSDFGNFQLKKIGSGTGTGHGETPVTKGRYLWGQDNKLYCVYVDGGGALTNDTVLTNCQ